MDSHSIPIPAHRVREETIYHLMEIFTSVKGEGVNTGLPMLFVRFAGCNLDCSYCDTPHTFREAPIHMTHQQLLNDIVDRDPKWIVFTGGEPGLSLTSELLNDIKEQCEANFACESNGMVWNEAFREMDYVVISPKKGMKVDSKWIKHVFKYSHVASGKHEVDELRYVIEGLEDLPWDCGIPWNMVNSIGLSPLFHGGKGALVGTPDPDAVVRCKELCWEHRHNTTDVRLSAQVHKLIGVR